jgi:hypothetical protein
MPVSNSTKGAHNAPVLDSSQVENTLTIEDFFRLCYVHKSVENSAVLCGKTCGKLCGEKRLKASFFTLLINCRCVQMCVTFNLKSFLCVLCAFAGN